MINTTKWQYITPIKSFITSTQGGKKCCGNLPQSFNTGKVGLKYHGNLPQYCFKTLAPGANVIKIL
jgi:hypothetical protein